MEEPAMSDYYEGSSEEVEEGINKLEDALNRAANKYFERYPEKKGGDPVTFTVIELQVMATHNPIHGYRVVLRPQD
jgi:hypothetical protein